MSEVTFDSDLFLEKVLIDYPTITIVDFRVDEYDINMYALRHPKEATPVVLQFMFLYDAISPELECALHILETEYGYRRYVATNELYKLHGIENYIDDDFTPQFVDPEDTFSFTD